MPEGKMVAVRYKVRMDAYPRFKYFLTRLSSIVSRLENIAAAGKFATCFSQGKQKLHRIMEATKHLQCEIHVTIVGDDVKIPTSFPSEILVHVRKDIEGEITEESVEMKTVVEDMKLSTKFHAHIIICLMTSVSRQSVSDVFDQFSSLDNEQQQNIIIYNVITGTNYSMFELVEANFVKQTVKMKSVNKNVGEQIQYLLEDRAVEVLEAIVDFNSKFALGDGQDNLQPIYLECSSQVFSSFRDPHVVEDLDPEKGWSSALESDAMDTGESPAKPPTLTAEQKDNIFYENLLEFLSKKTKCILCDHLAKKYGISASLVNEFLNEGYHDYERKYRESVEIVTKPKWERVRICKEASNINYDFITRQFKTLHAVEDYVKGMLKYLVYFEKLNFEVFGLLRLSQVPVANIPEYPKIPLNMSESLLSLTEVVGCGTIYGKLTVHVGSGIPVTRELEENVKAILAEHKYRHGYRIQTVVERSCLAGGEQSIEAGDRLKARLTNEGYEKLKEEHKKKGIDPPSREGTLGFFIGLREKTNVIGDDMECEGAVGGATGGAVGQVGISGTRPRLYGITCAHCVTDCHPDIQVQRRSGFRDFGQTELVLYDGEKVDIAAIRVTVDKKIPCSSNISLAHWDFYTGEAGDLHEVADVVYKHGATTDTTEGIIISNDYRPDIRENFRDSMMEEANAQGFSFHNDVNILIDILPANRSARQVYSSDADEQSTSHQRQAFDDQGAEQNVEMAMDDSRTQSSPNFTMPLSESAKVTSGEFVTLECVVEGHPKPQVDWYRRDKLLKGSEDIKLRTEGDEHTLMISKVYLEDAGDYRAVATNSAGRADSTCRLDVQKQKFSESGDSGSVVYYTNIQDGTVRLASLLAGRLTLYDERHGEVEFTYSSHLKKSLDMLCEEYNREIVMPWDM